MPLWAHYDEAAHYEYGRFVVEHRRLPQIADRDRSIFNRIVETDRGIVPCPEEPVANAPACFGPSGAFDEPPLYYLFQAAAIGAIRPATVLGDVRVMRVVSVLLSVLVVLLGYLTVRVVAPDDSTAALAVAGLLAAIPGYVDVMSGVNNDIGAVAAVAFFMWTMARLFRDGVSAAGLGWVGVAVTCCVSSKATAFIAIPLALVGVWLAAWPRLPRAMQWLAPVVVLMIASVATMGGLWPADWQAASARPRAGRRAAVSPVGSHVFAVWQEGAVLPTFWQRIDRELAPSAVVTIGAWVRTGKGQRQLPLPVFGDERLQPEAVAVTAANETWAFRSYTTVPAAGSRFFVLPAVDGGEAQYDGFVLADGGDFGEDPPTFDDETAHAGTWGGRRFVNLVRNASAESGWPALRYFVDRLVPAGGVNQRLASWLDWRRTWRPYAAAIEWQFVTFWGGYGNGVAYGPRWTRVLFAIVTAVSSLGLAVAVLARRRTWRIGGAERFAVFAAISVASALCMSVLRIDPVNAQGVIPYIPAARHTYVASVPMALMLVIGWRAWWPSRLRTVALSALVVVVLVTGVYLFVVVQRPWYADFACRQTACQAS